MEAASIDISPIVNVLLQLAATVLLGFGTWGVTQLVQWLGLKNSAQATANLDDALEKAVTYGLQQSTALIKQKGWDDVEVRNATLAKAAPYLIDRFPDALRAVGVDMNDQAALQAKVMGALDRIYPHASAVAAASPGTPPATAPQPSTTAELAAQPNVTTTMVEEAKA
jgi:hypothetical protein